MRWLALATLASALVPPHRPRPVRTRVYKLPQETVDLKFRAKGLLDDVKEIWKRARRCRTRRRSCPTEASRERGDPAARVPLLLRRACSRGGGAPSLPAHQRVGVEVAPPGAWSSGIGTHSA